MIPDCSDCGGSGAGAEWGLECTRCGGSGVEPLEIPDGGIDPPLDTLTGDELPEWLTSMHGDCPAPSALHKVLDPAGVIIEWACGLSLVLHAHLDDHLYDTDRYAERHDEALAKAEHELRLQRGVVTMRASRIGTVHASGGIISSGGFASPAAPLYDFADGPGPGAAGAAMPVLKAGRGSIEMNMTVTPEGASWLKELWSRGRVRGDLK